MRTLAIVALIGFGGPANALADCPELIRLRSAAAEAVEQMTGVPTSDCKAYLRFSTAWSEIFRYAKEHRKSCEVSDVLLSEFEKRHLEAVRARDIICGGRLLYPLPADIIKP